MEKENKPPPKPKPNPEKKGTGTPIGNNVVWYLIGIGIFILLVVGWVHQDTAYEIKYSDLHDLVQDAKTGHHRTKKGPRGPNITRFAIPRPPTLFFRRPRSPGK